VQLAAGRNEVERIEIGLEDANITVVQSLRDLAALLHLLLAGGRTRLDQDVAHS